MQTRQILEQARHEHEAIGSVVFWGGYPEGADHSVYCYLISGRCPLERVDEDEGYHVKTSQGEELSPIPSTFPQPWEANP